MCEKLKLERARLIRYKCHLAASVIETQVAAASAAAADRAGLGLRCCGRAASRFGLNVSQYAGHKC